MKKLEISFYIDENLVFGYVRQVDKKMFDICSLPIIYTDKKIWISVENTLSLRLTNNNIYILTIPKDSKGKDAVFHYHCKDHTEAVKLVQMLRRAIDTLNGRLVAEAVKIQACDGWTDEFPNIMFSKQNERIFLVVLDNGQVAFGQLMDNEWVYYDTEYCGWETEETHSIIAWKEVTYNFLETSSKQDYIECL